MADADSTDLVLLILRVGLGLMLAAHGLNHWRGGGKIAGTGRWFESIGLRHGVFQAWMSVITEIGAGLGLALGLLTPLCAGAGVALMLVAIWTVHRHNGFFITKEGWEYTTMIALTCLAIATLGPARWSLDRAIGLDDALDLTTTGWNGLVIALVAGVGGATSLLLAFWRKPAPRST